MRSKFQAHELPRDFRLLQNHPNPFWSATTSRFAGNPATTIEYHIPRVASVQLVVFDVMGKRVRSLVEAQQHPGKYRIIWDARNDAGVRVATGVYFYRIVAGNYVDQKKMILLR